MNDFDYPPQFSMILDDFRWFSDSKIAVNDFSSFVRGTIDHMNFIPWRV